MWRIGSLFSGIGGLELGLEWAGVGHTVFQVEADPACRHWLAQHWPDVPRFDDVRTVGAHTLPAADVLCGGFPCQDISHAGKGDGIAAGTRSGLWFEFDRLIGELRPRAVVIENVAALNGPKHRASLDLVLTALRTKGYRGERAIVSARDVGAPHLRKRLFILAVRHEGVGDAARQRSGEEGPLRRDGSEDGTRGAGRDVGDADRERATGGIDPSAAERGGAPASARAVDPRNRDRGVGDAEQPGLQGHTRHGDGGGEPGRHSTPPTGSAPAPCVRVDWGDGVLARGHDGTVRLIPAEAAQGGAQSPLWPVADGVPGRVARLRAIGNAVVPQVAEVVGQRLVTLLSSSR